MNSNQNTSAETQTVKPASGPQIDFLVNWAKMDHEDALALNAREASNLIGSFIKRRRDAERQPPTEAQLRFLETHGFNRQAYGVRTRGYCSRLIYRIKTGRAAA